MDSIAALWIASLVAIVGGIGMCLAYDVRDNFGLGIVGFVWFATGLVSLSVFTVLLLAMAVIKAAF